MERDNTSTPPAATSRRWSGSSGRGRKSGSGGTSRLRKSCDPCSLAKRRCDGRSDCSLCVKKGLRCIYGERQKSGPKGRKGAVAVPGSITPRRRAPFVRARESRGVTPEDGRTAASPPPKRTRPTNAHQGVDGESGSESYCEEEAEHESPAASRHGAGAKGGDEQGVGGGTAMSRNSVGRDADEESPSSEWSVLGRRNQQRGGDPGGSGQGSRLQPPAPISQKQHNGRSRESVVAGDSSTAVPTATARASQQKRLPGRHGEQEDAEDHDVPGMFDNEDDHADHDDDERDYNAYPPSKYRRTPGGAWGGRARQEAAEQMLLHQRQDARRNAMPVRIMRCVSEDASANPESSHLPDFNNPPSHRMSNGVDASSSHQRQQQWTGQRRPVSPSHVSRADLRGPGFAGRGGGPYASSRGMTGAPRERPWTGTSTVSWHARRSEAGVCDRAPGAAVGIAPASFPPCSSNGGESGDRGGRGSNHGRGAGAPGSEGESHGLQSALEASVGGRGGVGAGIVPPLSAEDAEVGYLEAERYHLSGRRVFGGGGPAAPAVMREREGPYRPYGGRGGMPGRYDDPKYWTHEGAGYQRWHRERRGKDMRAWGAVEYPGMEDQEPPDADFTQRRHLPPWPTEKMETMDAMGAGRAGQDKATWDRIAAAMMSTVPEAKEQWATYRDTLQRETWAVSNRASVLAGSRRDRVSGMWSGPPSAATAAAVGGIPPAWAAANPHIGWTFRADATAGGFPGLEGARPVAAPVGPDVDVYSNPGVYEPGRPSAIVGRCAHCGEFWQTNSPAAAGALQAGRWRCPPCESGCLPGPHPRHWEDDEGHVAVARTDFQHYPHYHTAEVYEPPAFAMRKRAIGGRMHPRVGGRSAPADYEEMEAIAHAIRGASAADQEGRETPHRSFAGGFERRRSPTPAPSSRSGSERRSSPPQSADASGISVASSRAPTEDENEEKGKEMVGKRKRMNASSAVVDTAKERNAAFQGVVGRSAGEGWAKSSSPTRSSTTITASGGVGSSADVENVVDERATAALSNMKNNNATSFDYDDESKAVKRSRPASTSPVDDKLSADEKAQGEVSAAARASSSIAQEEKAEKTETTENGDNQGEIGTATETRSLPSKSGRSPRDINTLPQSVETPVEKLLSKRSAAKAATETERTSASSAQESERAGMSGEDPKSRTEEDQGRNNVVEEISEVQEKTENDCEQRTTEYVESDRNELSKAVTTELMPDECRSRWRALPHPKPREGPPWLADEETVVMKHKFIGPHWATVAAPLPGRTEDEVKRYYAAGEYSVEVTADPEDGDETTLVVESQGVSVTGDARAAFRSASARNSTCTRDEKPSSRWPTRGHDSYAVQAIHDQQMPFEPASSRGPMLKVKPVFHDEYERSQVNGDTATTLGGRERGHVPEKPWGNRSVKSDNASPEFGATTLQHSRSPQPWVPSVQHRSAVEVFSPPPHAHPIHHHPASHAMNQHRGRQEGLIISPLGAAPAHPHDPMSVDAPSGRPGQRWNPGQRSHLPLPQSLPLPPSGTRGFGAGMPRTNFARGAGSYFWSGSGDPPMLRGFGRKVVAEEVHNGSGGDVQPEAHVRVDGVEKSESEPYGWYEDRNGKGKIKVEGGGYGREEGRQKGTEERVKRFMSTMRDSLDRPVERAVVVSERAIPFARKAAELGGWNPGPQRVEIGLTPSVPDDRVDMEDDDTADPATTCDTTQTGSTSSKDNRASPEPKALEGKMTPMETEVVEDEGRSASRTDAGEATKPSRQDDAGVAREESVNHRQLTRAGSDTQMRMTVMLSGRGVAAGGDASDADHVVKKTKASSSSDIKTGPSIQPGPPLPARTRDRAPSPCNKKSWTTLTSSALTSPARDPLPMKKRISPTHAASVSPTSFDRVVGRSSASSPSPPRSLLPAVTIGGGEAGAVRPRGDSNAALVTGSAASAGEAASEKKNSTFSSAIADAGSRSNTNSGAYDKKKSDSAIANTNGNSSSSIPSSSAHDAHKQRRTDNDGGGRGGESNDATTSVVAAASVNGNVGAGSPSVPDGPRQGRRFAGWETST